MRKNLIVVNLFGGPGSGKSTACAYVYAALKAKDINCEMAREFAKDKAWEKNLTALNNQAYIFGEQYYRLTILEDDVDVIITDSPILLSVFYRNRYNNSIDFPKEFDDVVLYSFNRYNNINYFIRRNKLYNPNGRLQTEDEAKELDVKLLEFLNEYEISFDIVNGNQNGYQKIVDDILKIT